MGFSFIQKNTKGNNKSGPKKPLKDIYGIDVKFLKKCIFTKSKHRFFGL
jgi:hypothetical protein